MTRNIDLFAVQRASMLRMGKKWFNLGKLEQAADTFLRVVQEHPGTAEAEAARIALIRMADNYETEGRFHLSIDILDRLTATTGSGRHMTLESEQLYLYAIIDGAALDDTPLLVGLGGAPVWLLPFRALAAVVGPVTDWQLTDSEAAAQAHEQVVEWFMTRESTLPVRFGTLFSNEAALSEALDQHYATLCADLQRLAGRVEVEFRILWDADTVWSNAEEQAPPAVMDADAESRLRYIQERLRAAAESLAQQCRERLAPHAEAITTSILETKHAPVRASLLVARGGADALVAEIAQIQRELYPLQVECSGPWPPYHFVYAIKGEGS